MKSMMVARSAVTVAPGAEWPASIGARSEWRGVTSDRKPRQLPAIPCVPLFSHSSPLTPRLSTHSSPLYCPDDFQGIPPIRPSAPLPVPPGLLGHALDVCAVEELADRHHRAQLRRGHGRGRAVRPAGLPAFQCVLHA